MAQDLTCLTCWSHQIDLTHMADSKEVHFNQGASRVVCPVCWENPSKPPYLHDPKKRIPHTKDMLIVSLREMGVVTNLATHTVYELRHMYSHLVGRKPHPKCPLVGMASMHKEDLINKCNEHGISLGEGKLKKADYALALREHWSHQCQVAFKRDPCTSSGYPSTNDTPKEEDVWSLVGNGVDVSLDDEQKQTPPRASNNPIRRGKTLTCVTVEVFETEQSSCHVRRPPGLD